MRTVSLELLDKIIELPKSSQEELLILLRMAREEDNLVIEKDFLKGLTVNGVRSYNRRIKPLKDSKLIKVIKLRLDDNSSKEYDFLMLNPEYFPIANSRVGEILWFNL